jgi:hypothetical protein
LVYADNQLLLKTPLSTINGLTAAADRIPYYTSSSAAALATLTTFGRSLIDDADAATARTTLGLGTAATSASTSFQAADATLTAFAGLTNSANKLPYFTATDTMSTTDITTAGREILSTASSGTSGQVLTSSGGGAPTWTTVSSGSSGTSTGYYGSFFDTSNQTHTSANTAKAMTLNQTPPAAGTEASGVSVVSSSRITVANAGVYNIQFSAQLDNSSSQDYDADIWIALNGTAVANSNTQVTVPGSHGGNNGNAVAAWNFVLTLAAGNYIELMWSVENTSISLPTYSAVSPHPATPSLIVTVSQVAVLGGTYLPTTQTWTVEWKAASGGATLGSSGFTLTNLTSGGLKQDTAGNWYEELTSTSAVGRLTHSTLAPSTTIPWEMEWDVACATYDGGTGLEADEGTGGRRSRMYYVTSTGQWEQSATAQLTGLFDIDNDDRVIMTMRSRPGGMRTYFVDGMSVAGSRYSADAATAGTARYCWCNGGATTATRTYRVYAVRLLHNGVATAPPYARIISTPVQP